MQWLQTTKLGFPGGMVVQNLPASAGGTGGSLIWEHATCLGATEPLRHDYCARELQLLSPRALEPELHRRRSQRGEKPERGNSSSPCSPQLQKSPSSDEDPAQLKVN